MDVSQSGVRRPWPHDAPFVRNIRHAEGGVLLSACKGGMINAYVGSRERGAVTMAARPTRRIVRGGHQHQNW